MRDRLLQLIFTLYRIAVAVVALPVILAEYLDPDTGSEYGVGTVTKLVLAARMARNQLLIPTGSTFVEHLVIATKLLEVPPGEEGCIVECGSYKGGSTANLSLVASLCDRRLHVFDSFAGMPDPGERDEVHVRLDAEAVHTYSEDDWIATLEEVRRNVARYGDPTVCRFHRGYFEETLQEFDSPCVAAFVDVGLRESLETCLLELWPTLRDGGVLFTHDVQYGDVCALFFDREWWDRHLDTDPPTLVGAGSGLGLHPNPNGFSSAIGYTVKNPATEAFETIADSGPGREESRP